MPVTLLTIPCLEDNYAFLWRDEVSGRVVLVDAPEPGPIQAALDAQGWVLTDVLLTHHHWDHVDGLPDLRGDGVRVWGAKADAHRLPALDHTLEPGQVFTIGGTSVEVWDVSGHTQDHIAFVLRDDKIAFTGDSLMAMGCGRLFEGTPQQMHSSLSQFAALPDDTLICSGHEYTASNIRFALTLEPENAALISRGEHVTAARGSGQFTVPSLLGDERNTNPFLRAHVPALKHATQTEGAPDADTFAALRAAKDHF